MSLGTCRFIAFNIISPEETEIRMLAELLRKKYDFEIVYNPLHKEGASMPYMSSRKAISRLEWKPISLEEGTKRMLSEMNPPKL